MHSGQTLAQHIASVKGLSQKVKSPSGLMRMHLFIGQNQPHDVR